MRLKYFLMNLLLGLFISISANNQFSKSAEYENGFRDGQNAARSEIFVRHWACLSVGLSCCLSSITATPALLLTAAGEIAVEDIPKIGAATCIGCFGMPALLHYALGRAGPRYVPIHKSAEYEDGYYDGFRSEFRKIRNKAVLTSLGTSVIVPILALIIFAAIR